VSAASQRAGAAVLPDEAKGKTALPAGFVEHIHIATVAGASVRAVETARAVAGVGLEGDRYASGMGHYQDTRVSRDLTLIEAEVVEALVGEHGIEFAPGETRRNVTTRGIDLNGLVGRRFWIGEVLCEGTRLCEPCQYLADLTSKPLLRALVHRGGLRADIVRGGVIRRGDSIRGMNVRAETNDCSTGEVSALLPEPESERR
jgi:MOSC domain-containing protein YiiM